MEQRAIYFFIQCLSNTSLFSLIPASYSYLEGWPLHSSPTRAGAEADAVNVSSQWATECDSKAAWSLNCVFIKELLFKEHIFLSPQLWTYFMEEAIGYLLPYFNGLNSVVFKATVQAILESYLGRCDFQLGSRIFGFHSLIGFRCQGYGTNRMKH